MSAPERKFVQEELDLSVCRNNCRMDEQNRYLDQLVETPALHKIVETTVPHKNFI